MTRIEITSRANPRLKELLAARETRFIFAGEKLVRDILARGIAVATLIVEASRAEEFSGPPAAHRARRGNVQRMIGGGLEVPTRIIPS